MLGSGAEAGPLVLRDGASRLLRMRGLALRMSPTVERTCDRPIASPGSRRLAGLSRSAILPAGLTQSEGVPPMRSLFIGLLMACGLAALAAPASACSYNQSANSGTTQQT